MMGNMLLDTPNTNVDCRKYRKDYGSTKANQRDWDDWLYIHATEYKFQNVIRKKYLYNYYPVQVRDLFLALRRDFFLGFEKIDKIIKHLINNNRYIEVDTLNQDDERKFHLYLVPRFPVNVQVPFSLLSTTYYDELKKFKDTHKNPQ
jgi:hypothetical protein